MPHEACPFPANDEGQSHQKSPQSAPGCQSRRLQLIQVEQLLLPNGLHTTRTTAQHDQNQRQKGGAVLPAHTQGTSDARHDYGDHALPRGSTEAKAQLHTEGQHWSAGAQHGHKAHAGLSQRHVGQKHGRPTGQRGGQGLNGQTEFSGLRKTTGKGSEQGEQHMDGRQGVWVGQAAMERRSHSHLNDGQRQQQSRQGDEGPPALREKDGSHCHHH
mmetsp:Transcript_92444/g.219954  ORF Transcript_92444/g.219954 Transcript_92444/m.219954 type:complete len:215 (-) Transcript_92444:382-1026(-)